MQCELQEEYILVSPPLARLSLKHLSVFNRMPQQQTISSLHSSKIKELKQTERKLPKIENQIKKLEKRFNNDLSLREQYRILAQIDELKNKLQYEGKNVSRRHLEYSSLIHKYLEAENTVSSNRKERGVLAMIMKKRGDKKEQERVDSPSREEILNRYMLKARPESVNTSQVQKTEDEYCFECERYMVLDDTRMVCSGCGVECPVITSTERPSLKDPPTQSRCYEYKRDSHLKDTMNKIQGKETTRVPDSVINRVILEIDNEGVKNLAELTVMDIRRYLQKHASEGLNDYYENSPQILYRITGIKPATFTPEQEAHILEMFRRVQEPFEKYKPSNRKNFLSYSYILYKFCQLLGYDQFLDKLKLFESREILHEQDQIWSKICEELGGESTGWVFIPTQYGGENITSDNTLQRWIRRHNRRGENKGSETGSTIDTSERK